MASEKAEVEAIIEPDSSVDSTTTSTVVSSLNIPDSTTSDSVATAQVVSSSNETQVIEPKSDDCVSSSSITEQPTPESSSTSDTETVKHDPKDETQDDNVDSNTNDANQPLNPQCDSSVTHENNESIVESCPVASSNDANLDKTECDVSSSVELKTPQAEVSDVKLSESENIPVESNAADSAFVCDDNPTTGEEIQQGEPKDDASLPVESVAQVESEDVPSDEVSANDAEPKDGASPPVESAAQVVSSEVPSDEASANDAEPKEDSKEDNSQVQEEEEAKEEEFHDTQAVANADVTSHPDDDEDYDTVEEEYRESDEFSGDDYEVEKEFYEGEEEEAGEEQELEEGEIIDNDKVIDEDEDKRNPQYIPKKGMFYEHDDRLTGEPQEKEAEETPAEENTEEPTSAEPAPPTGKNKKLWRSDAADSWGHDKFDEDEQKPKAVNELVNVYGYNIREESGPPRARRRRRYGRGPNKYNRNWEDEQAYAPRGQGFRGRGRGIGRGPRINRGARRNYESTSSTDGGPEEARLEPNVDLNNEDFPSLNESSQKRRGVPRTRPTPRPFVKKNVQDRRSGPSERINKKVVPRSSISNNEALKSSEVPSDSSEASNEHRTPPKVVPNQRPVTRGGVNNMRTFTRSDNSRDEPSRGNGRQGAPRRRPQVVNSAQDVTNRSAVPQNEDASKIGSEAKAGRPIHKTMPPRLASQRVNSSQMDNSSNRPKRYSSLRQRNMAEQNTHRSHQFYDTGNVYNEANCHVTQGNAPATIMPSVGTVPASGGTHYHPSYTNQAYTASLPPTIQNAAQSAPPIYNTPPPIQTPYIAPTASNINYGPPTANASYGGTVQPFPAPPAPATYQPSQPYTPSPPSVAVTQPQEVFHAGMAFYNTHTQSMGRNKPTKRPKAAIPIVPPPDNQSNGVGQSQGKFEQVEFILQASDSIEN